MSRHRKHKISQDKQVRRDNIKQGIADTIKVIAGLGAMVLGAYLGYLKKKSEGP